MNRLGGESARADRATVKIASSRRACIPRYELRRSTMNLGAGYEPVRGRVTRPSIRATNAALSRGHVLPAMNFSVRI